MMTNTNDNNNNNYKIITTTVYYVIPQRQVPVVMYSITIMMLNKAYRKIAEYLTGASAPPFSSPSSPSSLANRTPTTANARAIPQWQKNN